jgi:hypothetical protein
MGVKEMLSVLFSVLCTFLGFLARMHRAQVLANTSVLREVYWSSE